MSASLQSPPRGKLLDYPAEDRLLSVLDLLERKARDVLLKRFVAPQKKAAPYHNTQSLLASYLGGVVGVPVAFDALVIDYLTPTIFPAPRHRVSSEELFSNPEVIFRDASRGATPAVVTFPTFRSVAPWQWFGACTAAANQAESDLVPASSSTLRYWVDPVMETAERMRWNLVIRAAIAIRFLRALDYESVWQEKDGDAGWWLAGMVPLISARLQRNEMLHIAEILLQRDSVISELPFPRALRFSADLEASSRESVQWKMFKGARGKTVDDIGVIVPWEFRPIEDRSLWSSRKAVSTPSNMYARHAAIDRATLVRDLWEMVRDGARTPDGKLSSLVITAGTLEHGGAHPPHLLAKRGHVEGASFDFDLVPFHDWPQNLNSPEADKTSQSWLKSSRVFLKCIALSFPSLVIYIFQEAMAPAIEELVARVDHLQHAEKDEQRRDLLLRISQWLAEIKTVPQKDHNNHWHVQYEPSYLGPETLSNIAVTTNKVERAQQFSETLPLLRDRLFVRQLILLL